MRSKLTSVLFNISLLAISICVFATDSETTDPFGTLTYPVARRNESVCDDYCGTKVIDAYRWCEDPDSNETKKWVADLNAISKPALEKCDKWQVIKDKLTSLWTYTKYGVIERHGKYFYSYINRNMTNQDVVYRHNTAEEDPTTEFFNPNKLSADGKISLATNAFSNDGSWFAYGLSTSGSDWVEVKVRNTETFKDGPDLLKEVKFSPLAWTSDNKGFFYCRYPGQKTDGKSNAVNENQKLFYHVVGDPQSKDVLIAEFKDKPKWRLWPQVCNDGTCLIVALLDFTCGTGNAMYYVELDGKPITGKLTLKVIIDNFKFEYYYIANTGTKMVFRTNNNAPNWRLVVIDLKNSAEANWTTLIAEDPKDVLDWSYCMNKDKIVNHYIHEVKSVLRVNALDTGAKICDIAFDTATVVDWNGNYQYPEFFFKLQSFTTPGLIYKYDLTKSDGKPVLVRQIKINLDGFDPKNYKIDQVSYASKDGTQIPMYIVKNIKATGKMPCLMYGYGGFSIATLPFYNSPNLFFMDTFEGVLAFPNIRGGNEKGDSWHLGGCLKNKQNSFDDFQAAAEYLVQQGLTEYKKIAIYGGSNGGLLIAACINQKPNFFGAAIAQVGVMDMLRFPKFTIGAEWMSEYGDPSKKEDFDVLFKYSPLHNVRVPNSSDNQYPYILITTADHDDRVPPLHSLKFIAALYNAIKGNQFQKNAILCRIDTDSGHGAGTSTATMVKQYTDFETFLYLSLRITVKF